MRILLTSTGSWGTGSFMVIKAITNEFLKLGHKVKIFFPDAGQESNDKAEYYDNPDLYSIWKFPLEKNGVKLPNFPLMIPDPHPRNTTAVTFKNLSDEQFTLYINECKKELKAIIDEFQPNIIECQHIWIMDYIIQSLELPFFATAHHSDQMAFHYDNRMQKIIKQSAKHAQYIFSISDHVKQEVTELYEVAKEKIIVLPNGYDKTIFKRQKVDRNTFFKSLKTDIPPQADIITFAGKISHTKGIDLILQANRLLNNPNIHFLVFGTGDIKNCIGTNELKKLCTNNIHFLDHQPAHIVAQAHNIAKLSIAPSRTEGFGLACLEAMGCGLPVIATQDTGMESFAIGEIIEQENPEQLANAITNILNMPINDYSVLSKKAEITADKFSWEAVAKTRLRYYAQESGSDMPHFLTC